MTQDLAYRPGDFLPRLKPVSRIFVSLGSTTRGRHRDRTAHLQMECPHRSLTLLAQIFPRFKEQSHSLTVQFHHPQQACQLLPPPQRRNAYYAGISQAQMNMQLSIRANLFRRRIWRG